MSSVAAWLRGIFLINLTSLAMNSPSTKSGRHCLVLGSIRLSTFAFTKSSMGQIGIYGGRFFGSQFCFQMLIFSSFPILYLAPLWMISLPLRILFQAYDPILESAASIIDVFEKKSFENLVEKRFCFAKVAMLASLVRSHWTWLDL